MLQEPNHKQQDETLWKQMKDEGSVQAFEKLYDRYFPVLFAYGLQFCSNRAIVKDCLQDLFVDIYQRRTTLSDVSRVKQYLFVSFRHYVLRQVSAKNVLLEAISENYHFQVNFSREHQLISEQFEEERQEMLKNAFTRLSSRQKEAVFLRFYENMSYPEIAEVMNLKEVKYARTLVYRSLFALKSVLKGRSLTLYAMLPFFLFFPNQQR